ncbi:Prolyl endopeptidase [Chelonia mydas]|uniref:Prolyl endopeptidase n=1 Tax=Chelonia mydas TaxID=8469 RepID=M7AW83_CHEMY|nr:Prolyl endopeptidase [Chelonia mydas]
MTELYDYPKYSCHFKKGKRYFHFYNTGLQNQRVLYVQESLDADAKIFLDPNKLSDDGTVALRGYAFSEDGEYFAYGLSSSGSDWVTIKFMKVDGPEELPDMLERVKFSCMAWTHDGKGMFYNSYPKQDGKSDGTETSTNVHQKLFYHFLGTDQSKDVLCAEFPDEPKWMGGAEVSDDGRYVLLSIREGCDPVNRLWYCDLQKESNGITGDHACFTHRAIPRLELLDLISIWGEEAVQSQLCSNCSNYYTYGQISRCMTEGGHDRDTLQCRVKVKKLRNAYHKVGEANHCSDAVPTSCRFYKELDAVHGSNPTSTAKATVDSLVDHVPVESGRSTTAKATVDSLVDRVPVESGQSQEEEEILDEDVEWEGDPKAEDD